MMFGRMWFLKNLLIFVLVGQVTAKKITEIEARMQEMFNGKYDNSAQGAGPNSSRDFIQLSNCPVVVTAISPKPLILLLDAVNGVLTRVQLRSVEERTPGIITMEVYNITTPRFYKVPPQTFNRTEIENLRADEIEHVQDCKAELEYSGDHFFGSWQICGGADNGKHTTYGLNVYCDKLSAVVPEGAPEKSNLMPYDLVLTSEKCPLIDAPDNYKNICNKQTGVDNQ